MQKIGAERYVMLPPDGEDFLVAGDYYLTVVGEGVNPVYPTVGTGTSSATLTSLGTLAVTNLGTVTTAGSSAAVRLASAQLKAYELTIPAGTRAFEARLENRVGNPWMVCNLDRVFPFRISRDSRTTALMGAPIARRSTTMTS